MKWDEIFLRDLGTDCCTSFEKMTQEFNTSKEAYAKHTWNNPFGLTKENIGLKN